MLDRARYARLNLETVYDKVMRAERLSPEDGEALFACPDTSALGALAHHVRTRLHGANTYFVRNRHVNYSNVCVNRCRFCAFRRDASDDGAFTLSRDEIIARALDDENHPFAEIHIVGGCHPELPLVWFEDIFRTLKELRPHAILKAFTVVEIAHFAAQEGCGTAEVLARLKASGLAMLTGGGAEIFAPEVRSRICPEKISGAEYLRIAGEAHAAGLASNCSMLFGHMESHGDRVRHLCALREQQERSGGFVCFIPLAFQPRHNALADEYGLRDNDGEAGLDRLRTIAVSRLLLDNIPHIKAYWVMLGLKTAQAALSFGADDLDGTIMEEHIGHMAGASTEQALSRAELENLITGCGFVPVNRDALFTPLRTHEKIDAQPAEERDTAALSRDPLAKSDPGVAAIAGRLAEAFARQQKKSGGGATLEDARLTEAEAAVLYHKADLHTLGALAHQARLALHPEPVVTYVADRNINYSNICVCGCRFCAFFRSPGDPEGYVLSREELGRKIQETLDLGGTQILMQGGHHPDLPLGFYEDLLAWIRDAFPSIHIHAFSPPEIVFFADKEGLSEEAVISRLMRAGLHSIPGGGAEVLADRVRERVSPNKCSTARWLGVMEKAHGLGLRTTATMMFGHEETDGERLEHLFAVRALQDKTGGFTAFIPWTFQSANTRIIRPPESAQSYLRLLALSRLVLDNVPSIQASWVTMGPHIAQLALHFGANDFGSLMIEENVVAAAGVCFRLSRGEIRRIVSRAGFTARQRTMDYTLVEETA